MCVHMQWFFGFLLDVTAVGENFGKISQYCHHPQTLCKEVGYTSFVQPAKVFSRMSHSLKLPSAKPGYTAYWGYVKPYVTSRKDHFFDWQVCTP